MAEERAINLVDEAIESGRSAEEVCAANPDLLPEVRRLLRQYRHLEAQLDVHLPHGDIGALESEPGDYQHLPVLHGYEVLSVLGSGGMGVVFLARHLGLGRHVAVKMLLAGLYATPPDRERILREARSLATLRHPNIVSVHDVGESEGRPYFTMEHMEGGTLAAKLAGQPQKPDDAVRIALALARAVDHAHRQGIVHRDLKPANILLDAEGLCKISDFGIAQSMQAGQTLTLGGAHLGTPSYMAPEQARGDADLVGPAVDIYALGAILYEFLTGRPPFCGSTAAETHHQLLHAEPVPLHLVNAHVPRDVETICLKCLQKVPSRRYVSADHLAEDLRRFLDGEPILARPVGVLERGVKWSRRRPAAAIAIAAGALLGVTSFGVAFWTTTSRNAAITAVTADLTEALDHLRSGDLAQSRAALERAKVRIGERAFVSLREQLARAEADLQLVYQLDGIRQLHAETVGGVLNSVAASNAYANVFKNAGLGGPDDAPAEVATRVRASPIANALVEALDDWMTCEREGSLRAWVIETTQLADHDDDPMEWRRRARSASVAGSRETLQVLADEALAARQPAPFLYTFGRTIENAGIDSVPFLRKAQRSHPKDFWLTSLYANALRRGGPSADSIEYYRAALALRPDTMVAHFNLGTALGALGRNEEAEEYLREAMRLDPKAPNPIKALGLSLNLRGKHAEALKILLDGHALDPTDASLIAACLANNDRYLEAVDWYKRAVAADPKVADDRWHLRRALLTREQHLFALAVWKCSLAARPGDISEWDGYAELCLFVNDSKEYERARATLIDRFSDLTDPQWCERIGRACLLYPSMSLSDLQRVSHMVDRALASDESKRTWLTPYFMFARGLAAYRAGDFHVAITIAEGDASTVLPPMPTLLAALASERLGRHDTALRHLADASLTMDWTVARAQGREAWICHSLRREAEQIILPDLAALISGERSPRNDDELRAVLAACQATSRFGRWAHLWERSTASRVTGPQAPIHVVCTLALAASSAGIDADKYTSTDRDRWRMEALKRLSEQVEAWETTGRNTTDSQATGRARKAIRAWLDVPELATLRDPQQLDRLPEAHRLAWEAQWRRISDY